MEIELKSQSDDEIVFIVRDAEVPFVNAIRRVAMVNVPKIAIEDVNIIRNDSAMFNEVLAHRLGLTPLVSDLDAIEGLPVPEDDGWFDHNGVAFSLNEVGHKKRGLALFFYCPNSCIMMMGFYLPRFIATETEDKEDPFWLS